MHLLRSGAICSSTSGFDHPSAQGFFADLDPMPFGQLFGCEGRSEIVPVRLLQNRQSLSLILAGSLRLDARPRSPCTTTASPCFSIRFSSLRTQRSLTPIFSAASRWLIFRPWLVSTNPTSPVPLGSSRFVPSFSLSAVNRNFLLGSIRNFSLGRDNLAGLRLTSFWTTGRIVSGNMNKLLVGCVWLVPVGAALCATPDSGDFTTSIRPVLAQNCSACHNSKKPDVDFLKAQTAKDIEANRRLWHSVAEQLRNRSMPPVASKITEQERLLVATWVDNQLRATACNIGDYAGPVAERRLNRREYHNTVRDLLGVDVAASDLFPADGTGGAGFDTNGETLYIPPLLMERYLQSAQQLLDRVIVSPPVDKTFTSAEFVPVKEGASGARVFAAGDEAAVTIPAYVAGDYTVRVMPGTEEVAGIKLELKIDGAPAGDLVQEQQRGFGGGGGRGRGGGPRPFVLKVKLDRGPHVIGVRAASTASVASIAVTQEPVEASPEKRALHYRLLGLEPGDTPIQPRNAAKRVVATFLPKAWRRPVQASDINRFLALYDRSAERGDPWEEGVKLALKGVLVSPDFLFRIEDRKEKPGLYPVGQYEMATRLSYFLWSTMPDDELLRLAEQGRLQDPKVLTAQVDRMLDDSRSRVFTSSFIGQWLGTQDLGGKVMPFVNQLTPYHYTPESAADLRAEPVMLLDRLLGENRSLLELLTADYTYMTPRLAQFYGVEDKVKIKGDSFQLVEWPDDRRAGILGMGATLAITSQRLETHPVLRGAWVLDTLLGTPVPPPPPGVPPLPSDKGKQATPP